MAWFQMKKAFVEKLHFDNHNENMFLDTKSMYILRVSLHFLKMLHLRLQYGI